MQIALTVTDLQFKDLLEQLVEALRLHVKHHRNLLDIMERKKQSMIQMNREELEQILDLEREAIAAAAVVEEERLRIMSDVSRALNSPKGPAMRLAELVQYVGEDYQEELLDLREELRDVADSMDRLNKINRVLVMHSLDHLQLYIALLSGNDPDAKTYNKEGSLRETASSFLMDRRI